MTCELIISEKPSAAKRIAAALADGKPTARKEGKVQYFEFKRNGNDVIVGSAAGHLFVVAEKEKSFKYPKFDLEWKPSSEVSKSSAFSKAYLNVLKKLAKKADKFTVATDYDIEGEVIGLNIVREICKQDDARRMKFSTLTKDDLVEAYEGASDHLDWGQANAGETRHFLDWMYGINLSRALMTAMKKAGSFKILSIGRVQGPALKIIVDREKEIMAFEPVPYWQIKSLLNKGNDFEAWHKEGKFWESDKANAVHEKVKDAKKALVAKVEKSQYKQPPPNPFDLGSLQSEAYRAFGFNPKRTLQAAQNLYTAGYISYPRTGSQKLTPKIGFKKILGGLAKNNEYKELAESLLSKSSLKPNDGKKTDPAHPAIFPTGVKPKSLKGDGEKVYDLIVKRFLATFGEWAVREKVSLELDINKEIFTAEGKRTVEPAWHILYAPYVNIKEEELPVMKENDEITIKELELLEKETEPPRRYSQSSLVKELERRNLGTKATRADIVESLLNRGYVKDQSLAATKMGITTVDTLEKYCPQILDENLTRHFEEEMENIREKSHKKEAVLDESEKVLKGIIKDFDANIDKIGSELQEAHVKTLEKQNYLGVCPECKDGKIVVKRSKSRKRFAACDKYPDCTNTYPLPQTGMIKTAEKECKECNSPMLNMIRKGKRPQEVCINPDCPSKNIEKSKLEEKNCPKCDSKLVVKKSVYGSFYACPKYPKCRHTETIEG